MSAEESNKPNQLPDSWQRMVERLAKVTVEQNLDPGRMLAMLMRLMKFRNEVWPQLTEQQRADVMAELKRRARRKPRRYSSDPQEGEARNP